MTIEAGAIFKFESANSFTVRGELVVQGESRVLETRVLSAYPDWLQGLEAAGLTQDRRALRLPVTELRWQYPLPHSLELTFSLPAGAYATSVLRELIVPAECTEAGADQARSST